MKIEIIFIPNGIAPFWVRKAWIGLKVEAKEEKVIPNLLELDRDENQLNRIIGYSVKVIDALKVLENYDRQAYRWYEKNFSYDQDDRWLFKRHCCQLTC